MVSRRARGIWVGVAVPFVTLEVSWGLLLLWCHIIHCPLGHTNHPCTMGGDTRGGCPRREPLCELKPSSRAGLPVREVTGNRVSPTSKFAWWAWVPRGSAAPAGLVGSRLRAVGWPQAAFGAFPWGRGSRAAAAVNWLLFPFSATPTLHRQRLILLLVGGAPGAHDKGAGLSFTRRRVRPCAPQGV